MNFVGIPPYFFLEFSLISNVFIDIDGYENKVICILNHSVKGQCLSINLYQFLKFNKQLRQKDICRYNPLISCNYL